MSGRPVRKTGTLLGLYPGDVAMSCDLSTYRE